LQCRSITQTTKAKPDSNRLMIWTLTHRLLAVRGSRRSTWVEWSGHCSSYRRIVEHEPRSVICPSPYILVWRRFCWVCCACRERSWSGTVVLICPPLPVQSQQKPCRESRKPRKITELHGWYCIKPLSKSRLLRRDAAATLGL
jgi:hypothetical protein